MGLTVNRKTAKTKFVKSNVSYLLFVICKMAKIFTVIA